MTVYEELKARDLIAQTTGEREVAELINNGKAVFYTGYDPTADSLTLGHCSTLIVHRHLQKAGNKPIALIGGGTAVIGDPSGRTDMRPMLTDEQIHRHGEIFKEQIGRFIDFSDGKALFVNNADWLLKLNYVELLREVGSHFTVNHMLSFECFKSRFDRGLSFLEFNYMIMQSYDYYMLFRDMGCNLQFGGDDQWGNMLAGTELIRRKLGKDSHVLTMPLILTSDGVKMGKSARGALWIDAEKTSPFEFYQYFRNIDDASAVQFLKRLTFVDLDEVAEYAKLKDAEVNRVKERLAYEMTLIVHGENAAKTSAEAARELFTKGVSNNMPGTDLIRSDLPENGIGVVELLVKCGLETSKGNARRTVEQGGLTINDKKIDSINAVFSAEELKKGLVIRKGKKIYHRAVLVD